MYFNSTISDSTKLLKPVLVFMFAIAAALTGLTQITQHRSHPVDVYVGFLIGAFIAAYLVRTLHLSDLKSLQQFQVIDSMFDCHPAGLSCRCQFQII